MSAPEPSFVAPVPLVPLPARLGILLSGRGSNFEALAAACERGDVPGRIVCVISDQSEAKGLELARRRGIPAHAVERRESPSRAEHERRIGKLLEAAGVDLLCLAGFMRILSAPFVESRRLRILNIHPSLLPSFPGLEAQAQALRYGVKVTGATVHFVDAGTDTGPIVAQRSVEVESGDDAGTLAARILGVEHVLYAEAVRRVLEGGWTFEGRVFRPPTRRIPL